LKRFALVLLLATVIATVPASSQDAPELYDIEFSEKEAYFDVLQDRYVWFKVNDGFHMFDVRTGEAMWSQKKLEDFDGKFTLLWNESFLLYSTKKGVARLDVTTGALDWSIELEKLKFKDVDRHWSTDHGILLQIKNNFALLDADTGNEVWWTELQPNSDLANKGKDWIWFLGDRALILSKQGPVLLSLATGEVLWSVEDELNTKLDEGAVTLVDHRAIIYFKKSLRIVDLANARELAMVEGKIKETTSFEIFEFDGRTYLFFGYNKKLLAFDGDTGDKLWETAEGEVEGSVRWVRASTQPGKILLVDLRVDRLGTNAGTWLTMHSIDVATGGIGWSQLVGYSQLAMGFVNKVFSSSSFNPVWGDVPVWFEEIHVDGDNVVFLIKGTLTGDPLTRERDESQGLFSINVATGKVNYLTKFSIMDHKNARKGHGVLGAMARIDPDEAYPSPLEVDGLLVVATHNGMAGVDRVTGQIRWQLEETGFVTDMTLRDDGTVLAKVGGMAVDVVLEGGKMKYSGQALKPFGFLRVDPATGQIAWSNTDFEVDPTQAMAATTAGDILYGSDGDRLYALSLTDGQFQWTFDIAKQGKAGKAYGDKAWTMDMEVDRSTLMTTTTTTTTWSNPRRILRAEFRGTHFIVFGEKAIIRVNTDGQLAWTAKWKYSGKPNTVQFDPTFVGENDDIVFAIDGFHGIDGRTGEVLWSDKDVVGDFRPVGDDLLIVRYKKHLRGFRLN
jgi:outer membrane protein assembly factor BamB